MTRRATEGEEDVRRSRRRGLNRRRVVEAALELVDSDGLDGLSMRRLGATLGVEAMSLYTHVASKEELLDEILDLQLSRISLPATEGRSWETVARDLWHAFRRVLLAHPRAVPLFATRSARSVEALAPIELSLANLRRAGFARRAAIDAHRVLMSFTIGYVLSEVSLTGAPDTDPNSWGTAAYALRDLPASEVPNLTDLAPLALSLEADDQFDACLTTILVGLRKRHRAERATG